MLAAQAATPGSHLLRESAAAPLAALLARHRLQRRSFVAGRGRSPALVARRVAVSASVVDLEDNDYVPTVDISLARIKQGKRVGSGSFGEVFRGDLLSKDGEEQEESVVLKKKKARSPRCGTRHSADAQLSRQVGLNAGRFFRAEASVWRRLRGCKGLAPFLGVAGADVYLVWRDVGLTTLESVMQRARDTRGAPLSALAEQLGTQPGISTLRTLSRRLLRACAAVHEEGVVHRDVKPANILLTDDGDVLLMDLGAAADLVTRVNYDPDEGIFDPLYGPPEQYLAFANVKGKTLVKLAWLRDQPDLFDSFSIGMVLLQVAVPYMRAGDRMRKLKALMSSEECDLTMWRERLPDIAQTDFALLDEDDGAGWELLCKLIAPREQRLAAKEALKHRFVKKKK